MNPAFGDAFEPLRPAAAPPRLIAERAALLVVDMQYFDAHPDWGEGRTAKQLGVSDAFDAFFAEIRRSYAPIQSLLKAARARQLEVMHIRVAEVTNDSRDVGRKQWVRGLAVPKNSREAELLEEVGPIGDEIVVSKTSSGAFSTTNLNQLLRNLDVDTLIFTGTATGGCVESTARDALDLGFQVILVDDANVCSTRESHETALRRMAVLGAHVLSSAEVEKLLLALPPVDRKARSGVLRAEACIPKTLPDKPDASPYSLIFPAAVELPLRPETTALVLVDAQRFYGDPGEGLGRLAHDRGAADTDAFYRRVADAVPKMRALLECARHLGLLVTHVRTASLAGGRDLSPTVRSLGVVPHIGTANVEFLREVAPLRGEAVLDKPGASAVVGTGLVEILRNAGIDTVILAGLSAQGGIETTVRNLTDRNFNLFLPPDAIATYAERLQKGLWGMQSGIINVVSTSLLVNRLEAMRVPAGT
ncbi:MAG: cysteine hydrolase [Armatimonadetes bacterium]|nr:cysteine hydrolase [Armatimonadota bacterium]